MPQTGFEASTGGAIRRPKAGESLRVTWLIVWRTTAFWVLASVVVVPVFNLGLTGLLASFGAPAALIPWILQLVTLGVQPILILPVVVTMMLGKEFKGFEVQAERADGGASDLSYREALAPAWLLYWRTTVLAGIPILGLTFLLSLLGLGVFLTAIPGRLLLLAVGLPLNWIIVHSMFEKRFRNFSFTIKRQG